VHGKNGGVNGLGINQRFVALDVHVERGRFGCSNFGKTIRAREMIGTRHTHTAAELPNGDCNALVVRGNDHVGQIARCLGTLIDVLQHRLSSKSSERFSRETGGGKSGGDNAQNPRPHI